MAWLAARTRAGRSLSFPPPTMSVSLADRSTSMGGNCMRWKTILQVVDCHAEGESGQVIVGGVATSPATPFSTSGSFCRIIATSCGR